MFNSPDLATRNQYWFDLESGTIRSYIQNAGSAGVMICRLAKHLHNQQTSGLLETIAETYLHPSTRGMAYQALASIPTGDSELIRKKALRDKDRYVNYMVLRGPERNPL